MTDQRKTESIEAKSDAVAAEQPITVGIEELEEVVGGRLVVRPLNERIKTNILYNPDTCPKTPGTPLTTCMCPGTGIAPRTSILQGGRGGILGGGTFDPGDFGF